MPVVAHKPAYFYAIYTPHRDRVIATLCCNAQNGPMKTPTARTALTPRTLRGLGRMVLALLLVVSVFELNHLPTIASHQFMDFWRAIAASSLFLLFCIPASHRPHSGL
jgi:hypothetical protein